MISIKFYDNESMMYRPKNVFAIDRWKIFCEAKTEFWFEKTIQLTIRDETYIWL